LLYIKEQLLEKTISPYYIQHYSGSRLLSFLHYLEPVKDYYIDICKILLEESIQLSFNEKLLYPLFLHLFRDYDTSNKQLKDLNRLFPVINSYCNIPYKNFPTTKEVNSLF